MPRNFLKKNPDPRTTRTKTTRTQIQEHKPRTQNTNPKHRRQEDKNTDPRTQNTNRSPTRTQIQTQQ